MRLIATILTFTLFAGPVAAADTGRELVMSCTYGTLAGTLVGAASLAFTHNPGDNLNNVARGASLGLYAGILLGAYVAWVVPRLGRGDEEIPASGRVSPINIYPTLAANGVDGVRGEVRVYSF